MQINGTYGSYLTIKEAAKYLRLSYPRTWFLATHGKFGELLKLKPKVTLIKTKNIIAYL